MTMVDTQTSATAIDPSTPVPSAPTENKPAIKPATTKRTVVKQPIKRRVAVMAKKGAAPVPAKAGSKTGQILATKMTISVKSPANSGKPAASAKPVAIVASKSSDKAKKLKVIRDSFTMPSTDYDRIGALKKSCLALGFAVKKSELLRAGLQTLERLSADDLKRVITLVENIKTGRPAGKNKKHKGTPGKKG